MLVGLTRGNWERLKQDNKTQKQNKPTKKQKHKLQKHQKRWRCWSAQENNGSSYGNRCWHLIMWPCGHVTDREHCAAFLSGPWGWSTRSVRTKHLWVRFPASSSSWPSGKNKPWTASPPEAGKQTLWTLLEESPPVKAGHGSSKPVLGEEASEFKGMPSLGRGTRIHLSSHWEVAFKKKKTSERAYWFKNICHINMSFISALKIISLLYFWNS